MDPIPKVSHYEHANIPTSEQMQNLDTSDVSSDKDTCPVLWVLSSKLREKPFMSQSPHTCADEAVTVLGDAWRRRAPSWPGVGCVTSGKLLKFSEAQFP